MTPRNAKRSRASVLAIATNAATTRAKPRPVAAVRKAKRSPEYAEPHVFTQYFTLPEPPSANRYWRIWRGRAVMSAEARAYKAGAADLAARGNFRPFPPGEAVSITLDWYRSRKMGDLDNRIKVTLDALKGILFADDKQVVAIYATRREDPGGGCMAVMVQRAEVL